MSSLAFPPRSARVSSAGEVDPSDGTAFDRRTLGPMSDAAGRHADTIAALRRAVLMTPGAASLDERAAAESGAPTGTVADAYLEKVRHASYRIIDADIDSLTTAGLTEDAILELSLAAALGEATRGFDRSIRAFLAAPALATAHPPSGVADAEA
jgi:hypothetical protein